MIQIPNEEFTGLLASHPVLLMSSRSGRANTLTPITWYAPLSARPPLVGISLKPSTISYQYIRESGDFILGIPDALMLRAVHFCGIHSGRNMDKMYHVNMPTTRGKAVSPLSISISLANIECRVRDIHTIGDRPFIEAEVLWLTVDPLHYDNQGWRPTANLVYHLGGNRYRTGEEVVDMSKIRPGYVPPDSVL